VVDSAGHQVITGYRVRRHTFGLVVAPDGASLWVTNVLSHDLSVIDLAKAAVATVPVGHRPYCVAFAAGRAFVSNQYGDSVSVVDAGSLQTVATLPLVTYPEGIDSDGKTVWVVSWMDELLLGIDAVSLQRTATIPLGRNPRGFGRFVLAE
jgi:YVTN family beta-propeller protein